MQFTQTYKDKSSDLLCMSDLKLYQKQLLDAVSIQDSIWIYGELQHGSCNWKFAQALVRLCNFHFSKNWNPNTCQHSCSTVWAWHTWDGSCQHRFALSCNSAWVLVQACSWGFCSVLFCSLVRTLLCGSKASLLISGKVSPAHKVCASITPSHTSQAMSYMLGSEVKNTNMICQGVTVF